MKNKRYGTFFESYQKEKSISDQKRQEQYSALFEFEDQSKPERYGDLLGEALDEHLNTRCYGNLLDEHPTEHFICTVNKMKNFANECKEKNTKEAQAALIRLEKEFVENVRKELQNCYFLLFKCDFEDKITAFICGASDECQNYIKHFSNTKFKQVDFKEFTRFYGDKWKKLDNYSGSEEDYTLIFCPH